MKFVTNEGIVVASRPVDLDIDERTIKEVSEAYEGVPEKVHTILTFYRKHYIITERETAKEPYVRKKWRAIMEGIQKGGIRGLLAYSPDRVSRNLLEGGELIQAVDNRLVSLRFSTFHFENTAAGHMMLGFWLVFAEHYSRKLREDTERGTKQKFLSGLALERAKYGYVKNDDGYFVPDEFHFPLIQKAFQMKLQGYSDYIIVDALNEAGWHQRLKGDKEQEAKITPQKLSSAQIWRDTFFHGVFTRNFHSGSEVIDLRGLEVPGYEFQPAVSETDWLRLQEMLDADTRRVILTRKSELTQTLDEVRPLPNGMVILDNEAATPFRFRLPNRQRFIKRIGKKGGTLAENVESSQILYDSDTAEKITVKWSEIDAEVQKAFKNIHISEEDYQAYLYAKIEDVEREKDEREAVIQSLNIRINKKTAEQKAFRKQTYEGLGLTGEDKQKWLRLDGEHKKEIDELEERKREFLDSTRDYVSEQRDLIELLRVLPTAWPKASYVHKRDILEKIVLNIRISPLKNAETPIKIVLKEEIAPIFGGNILYGCGGRI